jgi:hypothetical protein
MTGLEATVRDRVRSGALRRDRHQKVRFGHGGGRPCDGCGRPVRRAETEVEADFADFQTLRFHGACFDVWRTEIRVLVEASP